MCEGLLAVQMNKTSDLTRSADFNWCLAALLKEAVGVVGGLSLKRWLQSPNKELFWNRWLPGCAGSCGPSWLFTHPSWRAAAGQSAAQQDGQVGPRPWKRRRQRRGVRDCSAECQGDVLKSFCQPLRQEQPASLLLIKQEVFKSHSRVLLIRNLEIWKLIWVNDGAVGPPFQQTKWDLFVEHSHRCNIWDVNITSVRKQMNCPPLLCFRSNRTGFHYQSFLIMRTFSGNLRNLQIFFFLLFSPESRTRYSLLNLCLRKSAEMKETNLTLAEMWFFSEGWGFAQCSSTLETSYLGCWKQNSRWDFTRWWIPEMVRGGGDFAPVFIHLKM